MIMEDDKMNNTKLNIINDELLKVVANIINTKLSNCEEKTKEEFLNAYINHVENIYSYESEVEKEVKAEDCPAYKVNFHSQRIRKLLELDAPEVLIKNEAYDLCDSMISVQFDIPLLSEEEKERVYFT